MEEEKKQPQEPKPKPPPKKKDASQKQPLPDELDELEMLDAMIRENKTCAHLQCNANIELFHW